MKKLIISAMVALIGQGTPASAHLWFSFSQDCQCAKKKSRNSCRFWYGSVNDFDAACGIDGRRIYLDIADYVKVNNLIDSDLNIERTRATIVCEIEDIYEAGESIVGRSAKKHSSIH